MSFIITIVIFVSCGKDYADPTITWEGPTEKVIDFNVEGDNIINLDIIINAEAKIDDFRAWKLTYKEGGVIPIPESISVGKDWKDLETYNYKFEQTLQKTDFQDNVIRIEFKFEVKDKLEMWGYQTFTVTTESATYTVTFNIIDGMDNSIDDAIVTFNGIENAAGNYVFNIEAGTYNYIVQKPGYIDATGTIEVTGDVNKTVVLNQ